MHYLIKESKLILTTLILFNLIYILIILLNIDNCLLFLLEPISTFSNNTENESIQFNFIEHKNKNDFFFFKIENDDLFFELITNLSIVTYIKVCLILVIYYSPIYINYILYAHSK